MLNLKSGPQKAAQSKWLRERIVLHWKNSCKLKRKNICWLGSEGARSIKKGQKEVSVGKGRELLNNWMIKRCCGVVCCTWMLTGLLNSLQNKLMWSRTSFAFLHFLLLALTPAQDHREAQREQEHLSSLQPLSYKTCVSRSSVSRNRTCFTVRGTKFKQNCIQIGMVQWSESSLSHLTHKLKCNYTPGS